MIFDNCHSVAIQFHCERVTEIELKFFRNKYQPVSPVCSDMVFGSHHFKSFLRPVTPMIMDEEDDDDDDGKDNIRVIGKLVFVFISSIIEDFTSSFWCECVCICVVSFVGAF